MSIASPLTLDDSAGTAKTFTRLFTTATESTWIQSDTNLTEPVRLKIRHESTGSGSNVIDRHNVNYTHTEVDAAGVPRTLTLNFTVQVPRSSAFSNTDVEKGVMKMINFLADQIDVDGHSNWTNLADLLIGVM